MTNEYADKAMITSDYASDLRYIGMIYDDCGEWKRAANVMLKADSLTARYGARVKPSDPVYLIYIKIFLRADMKAKACEYLNSVNIEMRNYYSSTYDLSIVSYPPHSLSSVIDLNLLAENFAQAESVLKKAESYYDLNYGTIADSDSKFKTKMQVYGKMGKALGVQSMLEIYSLWANLYRYQGMMAKAEDYNLKNHLYYCQHYPNSQERAWRDLMYVGNIVSFGKHTYAGKRFKRAYNRLKVSSTYTGSDLNYWKELESSIGLTAALAGEKVDFDSLDCIFDSSCVFLMTDKVWKDALLNNLHRQLQWRLMNGRFDLADSTIKKIDVLDQFDWTLYDRSSFMTSSIDMRIMCPSIFYRIKGNNEKADSLLSLYSDFALVAPYWKFRHAYLSMQHEMLMNNPSKASIYGDQMMEYLNERSPLLVEPLSLRNTMDLLNIYNYPESLYLTSLIEHNNDASKIASVLSARDKIIDQVTKLYFDRIRSLESSTEEIRELYDIYIDQLMMFYSVKNSDPKSAENVDFIEISEDLIYGISNKVGLYQDQYIQKAFQEELESPKQKSNESRSNRSMHLGGGPVNSESSKHKAPVKKDERCIGFFKSEMVNGYLSTYSAYHAIVYDKGEALNCYTWKNTTEIDSLILDLNYYFSQQKNCESCRTRLSEILFKPLMNDLDSIEVIRIKNDGQLNFLNWNILPIPQSDGKLISDRWEVYFDSDLKFDSFSADTKGGKVQSALLVGDITFQDNLSQRIEINRQKIDTIRSLNFNAVGELGINSLPHTRNEIEGIKSDLGTKRNVVNLTGSLATEREIEEHSKKAHVLHFATHGVFVKSDEQLKALFNWGDINSYLYKDPMLTSALLLSGSGNTIFNEEFANFNNDGILTALEIMHMDLSKTKLVVLSACESGQGVSLEGQGVMGLQRAFFVAGTEGIIVSYWKVDDKFSSLFMQEFYKNWLGKDLSIEAAFNEAQNSFRKKGAKWNEPWFWGSFALIHR